ncbi:hypothetical protein G6F35_018276 [Rhizopus arrhizus]|nr:hypothetical protein G6F35_018276 [Rhizopus arrhizus]
MCGNRSQTVRAPSANERKSSSVHSASRSTQARRPPPISTVPFVRCLNDSARPVPSTTGSRKWSMRNVTSIMGLIAVSGTGSPHCAAMRSAHAPAQFSTCGAV